MGSLPTAGGCRVCRRPGRPRVDRGGTVISRFGPAFMPKTCADVSTAVRSVPDGMTVPPNDKGELVMLNARHLAAAAAAGTVAVALVAAPAQAAPKGPDTITLICGGDVGTIQITTNSGHGAFTPGFIVGTHQVFIPYRLHIVGRFDGQVVFRANESKHAPINATATSCRVRAAFHQNGHTFTLRGTVTGVIRGHE